MFIWYNEPMSDSFIKADIFFFVATIGLVALTLLLMVGLLYIVSILRTIRQISKTAQAGTETIVAGLQEAKAAVSKEGFVPATLFSIFRKLYTKKATRKK